MILQEFTAAGTEVIMNAEDPARKAQGSLRGLRSTVPSALSCAYLKFLMCNRAQADDVILCVVLAKCCVLSV